MPVSRTETARVLSAKEIEKLPVILLNSALSVRAACAGPIIRMSQNRKSDKDRLQAQLEIMQGHARFDILHGASLADLARMQQQQIAMLEQLVSVEGARRH